MDESEANINEMGHSVDLRLCLLLQAAVGQYHVWQAWYSGFEITVSENSGPPQTFIRIFNEKKSNSGQLVGSITVELV